MIRQRKATCWGVPCAPTHPLSKLRCSSDRMMPVILRAIPHYGSDTVNVYSFRRHNTSTRGSACPVGNGTEIAAKGRCPAADGTGVLADGVSGGACGDAPGGEIGCPVFNGTKFPAFGSAAAPPGGCPVYNGTVDAGRSSHPAAHGGRPITNGTSILLLSEHPGAPGEAAPAGGNHPGSRNNAARLSGGRTATLSDSPATARAPPAAHARALRPSSAIRLGGTSRACLLSCPLGILLGKPA